MMSDANNTIIVLVRDMIFATKISATAATSNTQIKIVRDPAKLADHAGTRLIVDLNLEGAIEAAAKWRSQNSEDIIGFVSHTDAATIAEARAANIPRILARSQFVEKLADLLK
jgi:hypothetical protein